MQKRKMPPKPKKGVKSSVNGVGAIYGRYSSNKQNELSIEQQVKKCRELADEFPIKICGVYSDRAISGRKDRRPGFQKMLRDAEKGAFQYVLAWKSSRMGRNMLEALLNEAKLQELGIRVLYVEEDFDDTAAGRFAARSMMNINQFYSENLAEDVRRGMESNALACKVTNGTIPYGYKKGADGKFALDPPKAEVVKEIFSRVARGDALIDIARDLNARGLRTARGAEWNRSSFHSLLHNERYTGVYIYDNIRIEGGVPQIIDKGLFFRVQEVLKMKKNPQGRHRETGDYLLTGKLFCGHCKSPMTGISGTSKTGQLHYYYVCQKRRTEKACHKKNVRKEWIEREVAQAIKNCLMNEEVVEWIADSMMAFAKDYRKQTDIGTLESHLGTVEVSIKNLLSAIEKGIITDTTKSRLVELEKEQAVLKSKLDEEYAAAVTYTRDDVISAVTLLQQGNVEDKDYQDRLFYDFLVAVYLYDDKMEIRFNVTGQKNSVDIPLSDAAFDSKEEAGEKFVYAPQKVTTSPQDSLLRRHFFTEMPPVTLVCVSFPQKVTLHWLNPCKR